MSNYNNCVYVEVKGNYKLVGYEFKYGLRGDLFEEDQNGYHKLYSKKFLFRDKKYTIFDLRKYFNFN